MASSPNFHHYPQVELTSTSAAPSAPPLPDTDTRHVEPVMGYPHAMGYPPNHHPHILQSPPLLLPPRLLQPRQPFVCRRSAMAAVIALFVVALMVSAIIYTLYRPRTPVVTVVGMLMSNFTISGATALTADWEVKVTVENPSARMKATFGRTPTYIYYRNSLLSLSQTDPLELGAKRKGRLSVSMMAEWKEQWLEDYVIIEMQTDMKNGEMSFDVVMDLSVVYHHWSWWTSHKGFRVVCSIIRVGFMSFGNRGSMLGGDRECEVS